MKRKIILMCTVVVCGLLLFAGCSKSGDSTENSPKNSDEVKRVTFGLNETVENKGLCEMSKLYAEVLDDTAKANGWYYYCTDTDKSPAKVINWKPSEGNYTTLEVLFTVKNTSDKPQKFIDKITAKMTYQENENSQIKNFDGVVFQQNPGQVEERGEVIMWSTKPVEIAAGQSTNVSFRFDIPKEVYDKVFATASGTNTGIREICEFSFDDKTTYEVDLTKTLILASKSSQ